VVFERNSAVRAYLHLPNRPRQNPDSDSASDVKCPSTAPHHQRSQAEVGLPPLRPTVPPTGSLTSSSKRRQTISIPSFHRNITTVANRTITMNQQAISRLVLTAVTADKPDQAIAEAVQKIAAQTTKISASELGDFVWDVYNAVFDVSAQLQKQSNLVDFLVQLRQTSVSGSDGQQLSYEGGNIWTDLPTFGWVARDLWNFGRLASRLSIQSSLAIFSFPRLCQGAVTDHNRRARATPR
jgi:hypothetical protein